jgi:hypothetical protein
MSKSPSNLPRPRDFASFELGPQAAVEPAAAPAAAAPAATAAAKPN